MKIYSSRQTMTPDRFVGQDVWVRARVRINGHTCYGFIKLLSKQDDVKETSSGITYTTTTYTFNEIDVKRLSRGNACVCTQTFMDSCLNRKYTESVDCVEIPQPVEVIDEEDLFVVRN